MPKTLAEFTEAVETLAAAVSRCSEQCMGITYDRNAGVLPRCLFLEPGTDRDGAKAIEGGTVVVGLNPGKMKKQENRKVNDLLDGIGKERSALTADDWRAYTYAYYTWMRGAVAASVPYYTMLRFLIRAGGRRGPILWTELVKCQSSANEGTVKGKRRKGLYEGHPATVRRCTAKFLTKELELVPTDWPILAAGTDVFGWVSRAKLPGRTVVGVPHPSGAAFQFLTLFPPMSVDARRLEWTNGKWHSAKVL